MSEPVTRKTGGDAPPVFVDAPRPITEGEFRLIRDLIFKEVGINLASHKKALVMARLAKRLRALGLRKYGEYYDFLKKDESGQELIQMIDLISTNETRFFREPQQFEYLQHTIIPQLQREAADGSRDRVLRVWSAACSMGHEPYTIAMVLKEHLCKNTNWRVEIIASDISTRVLQQARDGVWDIRAAEQIPQHYLKRYMRRGTNAQIGKMRASPELRSMIRFERINLNHAKYDVPGQFDLIFCRNALIYFNQQAKVDIVNRLLDRLTPGGFFFLGHAESLANISKRATNVIPAVYQLHTQPTAKAPLRRAAGE